MVREASPNHWRGTRRHLPVRRTRRQVRAREIVILVAGAELLRSYSAAFRTTTHVHGMRVAVVTLPGKVASRMAIHASRVMQHWQHCLKGSSRCRRSAWHARLADAAVLFIVFHDVHFNLRCFIDSKHRVIVEITLLNAALLESELVIESRRQPEDHSALHLRFNDSGIHGSATINRAHYAMNSHLAAGIDRCFGDLRGVAFKRCMHCDSPCTSCRQRLSPSS